MYPSRWASHPRIELESIKDLFLQKKRRSWMAKLQQKLTRHLGCGTSSQLDPELSIILILSCASNKPPSWLASKHSLWFDSTASPCFLFYCLLLFSVFWSFAHYGNRTTSSRNQISLYWWVTAGDLEFFYFFWRNDM